MKTHKPFFRLFLSALVMATPLFANPRGTSNLGHEYIVSHSAMSPWSVGIYHQNQTRDVLEGRFERTMDYTDWAGFVGIDPAGWLSLYLAAGGGDLAYGSTDQRDDQHQVYGAGAVMNLLDQEILDPTLFEDRLRINASLHYMEHSMDGTFTDLDWTEVGGSLTASIVNDVVGNKLFVPMSMALFGGLAYSDFSGNISALEEVGLTIGLDVFVTKRVALNVEHITFAEDNDSTMFGATVRF